MSCWPTAEECSNSKLNLNLSPPSLPSFLWRAFFCRNQLRSQLKAKIPEIGFYPDKKTRTRYPDGVGCVVRLRCERTRYFASRCSSCYYQDSDRPQHNLHTDTTNTDCCLIIINLPPAADDKVIDDGPPTSCLSSYSSSSPPPSISA